MATRYDPESSSLEQHPSQQAAPTFATRPSTPPPLSPEQQIPLDSDDRELQEDYAGDPVNYAQDQEYQVESMDPKEYEIARFCRNCLFCTLFMVLLLGLVGISKSPGDSDDEASSPVGNYIPLKDPPKNLAQVCSAQNVLGQTGYIQCEQVCEQSDCCHYPTSLALSCITGNEEPCLAYHEHCAALSMDQGMIMSPPIEPIDIPKAPDNLAIVCDSKSIPTKDGFALCQEGCMQAECCWKKDGTVHPCSAQDECKEYTPCLVMDAADHIDTAIEMEITVRCSQYNLRTADGRANCATACEQASCCFDPQVECLHENEEFCLQYNSCSKLFTNEVTKDDINKVCVAGNLAQCHQICLPGRCCFLGQTCNDEAVTVNCGKYDACEILYGGEDGNGFIHVPNAPTALSSLCAIENLSTMQRYELCQTACVDASCCWKVDGTDSCADKAVCEDYYPCLNLNDVNKPGSEIISIPTPPDYLEASCQEESLVSTSGFELCRDACIKAECCWNTNDVSSLCTSQAECKPYITCSNLIGRLGPGFGTGGANVPNSIPDAPDNLGALCDVTSFVSLEDFDACEEVCDKAGCCWQSSQASCTGTLDCDQYLPCTKLNGEYPDATGGTSAGGDDGADGDGGDSASDGGDDGGGGSATDGGDTGTTEDDYSLDVIFGACFNHDNNLPGQNLCETVCDRGSCCFLHNETCPVNFDCTKYDPCGILYPDNYIEVQKACSSGDRTTCIQICAEATCCFEMDIDKLCPSVGTEIVCEEYTPCEVLYV